MSPGCIAALRLLYVSWLTGSSGFETQDCKLPRSSKWYNPTARRFRILEKHGYSAELDSSGPYGNVCYRITPSGVAAWDIMTLEGVVKPATWF